MNNLTWSDVIQILRNFSPSHHCSKHGCEHLVACSHCFGVECIKCNPKGCQCWNDE